MIDFKVIYLTCFYLPHLTFILLTLVHNHFYLEIYTFTLVRDSYTCRHWIACSADVPLSIHSFIHSYQCILYFVCLGIEVICCFSLSLFLGLRFFVIIFRIMLRDCIWLNAKHSAELTVYFNPYTYYLFQMQTVHSYLPCSLQMPM